MPATSVRVAAGRKPEPSMTMAAAMMWLSRANDAVASRTSVDAGDAAVGSMMASETDLPPRRCDMRDDSRRSGSTASMVIGWRRTVTKTFPQLASACRASEKWIVVVSGISHFGQDEVCLVEYTLPR